MIKCNVPCKDCKERTIPKTCEHSCKKWAEYKKELDNRKSKIKFAKDLEKAINRQIWRNSNENY